VRFTARKHIFGMLSHMFGNVKPMLGQHETILALHPSPGFWWLRKEGSTSVQFTVEME
jgi:hypothetical protein